MGTADGLSLLEFARGRVTGEQTPSVNRPAPDAKRCFDSFARGTAAPPRRDRDLPGLALDSGRSALVGPIGTVFDGPEGHLDVGPLDGEVAR
jgi:hypothetical protein